MKDRPTPTSSQDIDHLVECDGCGGKFCKNCNSTKCVYAFGTRTSKGKRLLLPSCKMHDYRKKYRENHPEKNKYSKVNGKSRREQDKLRRETDAEFDARYKEWQRARRERDKLTGKEVEKKNWYKYDYSKYRSQQLKKYGLSPAQYDELLTSQNGVCAICHKPESIMMKSRPRPLAVDHDHITGRVRGLLCFRCNTNLSVLEDASFRESAQNYLKQYGDVL